MERKRPSFGTQLIDLSLVQLSNWRWSWRGMLLTGIVTPVASMVGLSLFARDAGAETLVYIFTGNLVLALMFENLDKVSSNFAYMKAMGTLTYFATLPVHRYALILASLISFFLMSLPALGITMLVGWWWLDVSLHLHPLLLLTVPLIAVSLAAVGAVIGTVARVPEEAGSLTLLLIFLLTAVGPVIVPPSRLPGWLLTLGYLSPATYAASALRQTLLGPVNGRFLLDLLVLTSVTLFSGHLAGRKMNWR